MDEYRNNIILEYVNVINSYIIKLVNAYKLQGNYTIKVESLDLIEEKEEDEFYQEIYEVTLILNYKDLIIFKPHFPTNS